MLDCIFCKFATGEIPKEFILETDRVMVFPDINPVAAVHLLIVPKSHIKELMEIGEKEKEIFDEMMTIIKKLITEYKLNEKGYRMVTNGGGAQGVDHFHLHLIGEISKAFTL